MGSNCQTDKSRGAYNEQECVGTTKMHKFEEGESSECVTSCSDKEDVKVFSKGTKCTHNELHGKCVDLAERTTGMRSQRRWKTVQGIACAQSTLGLWGASNAYRIPIFVTPTYVTKSVELPRLLGHVNGSRSSILSESGKC